MAPGGRRQSKMHLVALAVLTIFAIAKPASQAFALAPPSCQGIDARARLVPQSSSTALCSRMQVPRGTQNWFLSSAALFCATIAMAAQALQHRVRLTKPRCHVVACRAMAAPVEHQLQSFLKTQSTVSTPIASTVVPCILDMQESEFCTHATQPVSLSPHSPVSTTANEEKKVEPPALRSVAHNTRRPARFVAGVRLPARASTGKSTNPRTARSARRAVGARLAANMQYQKVQEPSFDCSRVRVQIQAGLQSSCHVRVQRAKEFKTPAAGDGGQAEHVLIKTFCLLDCATTGHI